jgi:tripartite-type tricarboxylate transporter receptor subunit TctC
MKSRLLKLRIHFFLIFVLILLFSQPGYPQEEEIEKYPSRPITFIQPFSAGPPADLAIRLISKQAEKFLGQPIVVVNKPGAGGSIGVAAIAKSKPDGYTIGSTTQGPLISVPLLEKVPYHPIKDLRMIMQFGAFNMGVIVKSDSPFKSFKDLIDYAHKNPKKMTYSTAGANSLHNICMQQIAKEERIEVTHIPQKSSAEIQTALLGKHIDFGIGDFNYTLLDAGEIRLILLLREERAAEYPQTPILKDLGYDFPCPTFLCVAGPKAIPDRIAKKLEEAYTKGMKEPEFINGMKENLRLPVVYRNSKDFGDYTARNYGFFKKLFEEMGLIK